MRQNQIFLITFFALLQFAAAGQPTIGLPEITSYSKQVYRGGAQTRKIAQDKSGVLYFANDEGLLTFNGARWKLYPLPNKSLVRSLRFGADNYLYVGGQDEFGYFAPGTNGGLQYHSLKNLIPPEARSFADVWEICQAGASLFFQTADRIYQLSGSRITVYKDGHWQFMGSSGSDLFAQSATKGLLRFANGGWVPAFEKGQTTLPADCFVTSLTRVGKDSTLLTTLRSGFYLLAGNRLSPWNSPAMAAIAGQNVSSACMVNENQVAIGTNLAGCFVFDKGGRAVLQLGRREGMQNNSILTVFLDQQQNLWFGLHNGIDFIPYNNAVKHINPPSLSEGAGFASILHRGQLYLGTSIGLFRLPVAGAANLSAVQAGAVPVKNSTGEVWNLSQVAGRLLMGHNEGAFLVDGDEALPLDKTNGYWNFQPLDPQNPNGPMMAGTYTGIAFYNGDGGRFVKAPGEARGESARFVVKAHNRVWFSHPYKGIYSIAVNDTAKGFKKYGEKEGVTSVNNNYLFKIKDRLLLTTENGVLAYDEKADRFEPSAFYNRILPRFPIRYLKEDTEGNVWFVFEKRLGVLDLSTGKPQVIYFPELTNKLVAGFEHINPVDPRNILLGGEKGFYHINYEDYKRRRYPLEISIGAVAATNHGDSLLFGGYAGTAFNQLKTPLKTPVLNYDINSLRFEFSSPLYGQLANIEYSYGLDGFDRGWSEFDRKTEKDYTNLPPGRYVFKVKARSNLGNESAVAEWAFRILPPWYQTGIAYAIYVLLLLTGIGLYYRYQQKKFTNQQARHEEEQRRLQYLHQLELDKAEKELVELRNQKLEAEIHMKNTELASTAMHLVQKSDVLLKIKEQMTKLKDAPAVDKAADLKKILKTLNEEHKTEEQWQQFSLHFDAVHRNFLSALKTRHPDLTPNEQKLCAYLKMNLSTKEIAQLMNISTRGVEISRYRLRKKLGVPGGMHLFNFLDRVTTPVASG